MHGNMDSNLLYMLHTEDHCSSHPALAEGSLRVLTSRSLFAASVCTLQSSCAFNTALESIIIELFTKITRYKPCSLFFPEQECDPVSVLV